MSYEKSAILFRSNTPSTLRAHILDKFQIHNEAFSKKYLGLPTIAGWQNMELSNLLRIEFGKELNGGKKSFYQKEEKKFW